MLRHAHFATFATTLLLAATCSELRAEDSDKVKAARELLQLWAAGKNEEFVARSDEQMRAAMGPDKLAQAWAMAEFQHGKYVGEQSAEEIPAGQFIAVRFKLKFERASLTIRFVLTPDNKLTGLWFDAVEPFQDDRLPPYAKKEAFRQESLTLRSSEYELPAILTLPAGEAKAPPAVVFVHGSGPHDADETIGLLLTSVRFCRGQSRHPGPGLSEPRPSVFLSGARQEGVAPLSSSGPGLTRSDYPSGVECANKPGRRPNRHPKGVNMPAQGNAGTALGKLQGASSRINAAISTPSTTSSSTTSPAHRSSGVPAKGSSSSATNPPTSS